MSSDRDTISLHNIHPDGGIRLDAQQGEFMANVIEAGILALPLERRLDAMGDGVRSETLAKEVCNLLRGPAHRAARGP
jgi:hypothetical protein